jgi:hypothetical protein
MPTETDTYARLIHFFSEKPELALKIISEPSNVEIWEDIFIYFFGETPRDDTDVIIPIYWRTGSSDPRWDTLLFKKNLGAMQALDTLIEAWRSGSVPLPSHKEAA